MGLKYEGQKQPFSLSVHSYCCCFHHQRTSFSHSTVCVRGYGEKAGADAMGKNRAGPNPRASRSPLVMNADAKSRACPHFAISPSGPGHHFLIFAIMFRVVAQKVVPPSWIL